MPSDSDRILAEGVPIALNDGRELRLRYGMRSLKYLEDSFGDLDKADASLGEGKVISSLITWMAAGLLDEGIDEDSLLDLALTNREAIRAYIGAVKSAIAQAMGDDGPKPRPKGKGRPRSTGEGGTTSPPLSSVEPMSSSGA